MFPAALKRWLILGGALLATLVASVWPRGDGPPAIVAPVTRREVAPPRQPALPVERELPKLAERLERTPANTNVPDLFGATNWNPPPQPVKPRPVPPPAMPVAPPFPYAITGSADGANGLVVVFSKQNQDYAAKVGDLLEQTYRVEAIDAQSVTVTYLPLGLTQVVAIQRY